jgi:di/tripeptidase
MDSLLWTVLEVQSESGNVKFMNRLVKKIAESFGAQVKEDKGNIYVTKGEADSYNCIVAHTDTVHRIIPQNHYKVLELEGRVFAYNTKDMKPTGIGGDDKCGIAIALTAIRDLPVIKAAFFRDEETGGEGSQEADMSFFNDCNFVLQCDRKGNSGFVDNIYGEPLYADNFREDIYPVLEKYGYKEVEGMFTDVYQLACNDLPIACANIECGYYAPHTSTEYIILKDWENCKKMVLEMLSTFTKKYKIDRVPPYSGKGRYSENRYFWEERATGAGHFDGRDYWDFCWSCNEYDILNESNMCCEFCTEAVGMTKKEKKSPIVKSQKELFLDFKL